MKKLMSLIVLTLLISTGLYAAPPAQQNDLVSVFVNMYIEGGIVDMGSQIRYKQNGVYHTENFVKGRISHDFRVDANSYIEVQLLISGGSYFTSVWEKGYTYKKETMQYADPCTNGVSVAIDSDKYTSGTLSLYFSEVDRY